MKTFPTYDYTLCSSDSCKKRESCVRYLTYQKTLDEKYPYMLTVYKGSESDCKMYFKSK